MFSQSFLRQQEARIKKRIAACEQAIRSQRIDAAFKAQKILGAQRHALGRLHAGLYGQCIRCGGDITKKRLEAIPAALRCQPCQKKSEK